MCVQSQVCAVSGRSFPGREQPLINVLNLKKPDKEWVISCTDKNLVEARTHLPKHFCLVPAETDSDDKDNEKFHLHIRRNINMT